MEVIDLSKQPSNMKSQTNQQGAGSQYHKEHAENVQGYGSNAVGTNDESITNMTDKSNQ